jgi:hypothetical protein
MKRNKITLSNTVVRAYIKRNKKISLHLESYLLIQTEKYFDSENLKGLSGKIKLLSSKSFNFHHCQYVSSSTDYDYNFNNRVKAINVHLSKTIDFTILKNSVIDVEITCSLPNLGINGKKIKAIGLLKKMYDERRFKALV